MAVGAPNDDTKSDGSFGGANWNAGAVHILFLNRDGGLARATAVINDSTDNGPALEEADSFGHGIANIGDLDDNGKNDIAVGAMLNDQTSSNSGAVHILFLAYTGDAITGTFSLAKTTEQINDSTDNGPTIGNGYWFGSSVANIGDLDGNLSLIHI